MTYEEVDEKLPNGFHDAKIRGINVDFIGRSITISMELLIGLPDTATPEGYRNGTLTLLYPYLFFVEPPDPTAPFIPDGSSPHVAGHSIEAGESAELDSLLQRIPSEAIAFGFFLHEWNSCINLACKNVEFSWDDGEIFD